MDTKQTVIDGATYEVRHTYDSMDREVATTYPDGEVVSRTFTSQGLTNVVSGATSYQSAATYNAAGQPTQLTFGNGRNQHFTYRPDLRLETLTVSPTAPATMYTYGYDLKGNVSSITDSSIPVANQTTNFSYDERDRLTSVGGGTEPTTSTFQYDTIGNMTRKEEGAAQGPPENAVKCQNPGDDDNDGKINDGCTTSYSSLNYACSPACSPARPHAVKTAAGSDGTHAFSYDASGNTTRETLNGADLRLYEYDAEGRLARAQLEPGTPFSNYTYDADGQLVKLSGPKRVVYIDGIFEKNLDTGEVTKYYFADGRRIAMRRVNPDDFPPTDTLYFLANDHLGGTAVVMDAGGNQVSGTRYYPYGMAWRQNGASPTDRMFTGHELMGSRSGTYYANARFYSADMGRFPQPDTWIGNVYEPQDLNRYTYVRDNPTSYTDSTGHFMDIGTICCWGDWGGGASPGTYSDPAGPPGIPLPQPSCFVHYNFDFDARPDDKEGTIHWRGRSVCTPVATSRQTCRAFLEYLEFTERKPYSSGSDRSGFICSSGGKTDGPKFTLYRIRFCHKVWGPRGEVVFNHEGLLCHRWVPFYEYIG